VRGKLYNGMLTKGDYSSEYVALLGTLIMWVFWPSFNASVVNLEF
jgi:hypothetical protein